MTAGELIEILERWPADALVEIKIDGLPHHVSERHTIDEVWRSALGVIIIEG